MKEFLHNLAVFFGSERYSQHAICLTSDYLLITVYTAANMTIGFAYVSIAVSLATKRKVIADLNAHALALYAAFIFLCACTHFSSTLVIFTGVYRLDVAILAATAAVSAITAFYTVVAVWGHSDS